MHSEEDGIRFPEGQLDEALRSAYTEQGLKRMLEYRLHKDLQNYAGQNTELPTIVLNLIVKAKKEGWLLDLVRAAREENPGNAELRRLSQYAVPYFEQGKGLYDRDKYAEAEASFETALALGKDDTESYYWRACARYSQEKYAEAETDFDTAEAQGRCDAEIYYWRACARYCQDKYAEAEADFDTAVAQGRCDAETYSWRGWARYNQDRYVEAEADFDTAVAQGKRDATTYYGRGLARYFQCKYADAEADLSIAIRGYQNNGDAFRMRALCYIHLEQMEQAEQDCAKASELEPDSPSTQGCYGYLYLAKRVYDQAIARCQTAVEGQFGTQWPFALGLVNLLAGNLEEAQAAYRRGIGENVAFWIQDAAHELDFWVARQADRVTSDNAQQLVIEIRTQLMSRLPC